MSELARWDHAKWLQDRLGEARRANAELEARVVALAKLVLSDNTNDKIAAVREARDILGVRSSSVLDTGKRETAE